MSTTCSFYSYILKRKRSKKEASQLTSLLTKKADLSYSPLDKGSDQTLSDQLLSEQKMSKTSLFTVQLSAKPLLKQSKEQ